MTTLLEEPTPAAIASRIRVASPGDDYTAYHAPRYASILALLRELDVKPSRICDVGRSKLTELIAESFGVAVDTLGFQAEGPTPTGDHYRFDLNDAQDPERWRRDLPEYDLVVFAEVLEHLHTAPTLVLRCLSTLVAPNGRLIVQTPNAVAIHKRLQMVLGKNPFERIREDVRCPGHFREYTLAELRDYARQTGFVVERARYGSYFDFRYSGHGPGRRAPRRWRSAWFNLLYRLVPGSWKPGITLVLRREPSH